MWLCHLTFVVKTKTYTRPRVTVILQKRLDNLRSESGILLSSFFFFRDESSYQNFFFFEKKCIYKSDENICNSKFLGNFFLFSLMKWTEVKKVVKSWGQISARITQHKSDFNNIF